MSVSIDEPSILGSVSVAKSLEGSSAVADEVVATTGSLESASSDKPSILGSVSVVSSMDSSTSFGVGVTTNSPAMSSISSSDAGLISCSLATTTVSVGAAVSLDDSIIVCDGDSLGSASSSPVTS